MNKAISLKAKAASSRSGTEPFDQVWCVIDGDYADRIPPARARAEAHQIELAISTKCFEHWILLHYQDHDRSAMDCDAVIKYLKKRHLPNYHKGRCDFHPIAARFDEARERAERLRKPGIRRGELSEDQNPCSEVYRLINAILDSRNGRQ